MPASLDGVLAQFSALGMPDISTHELQVGTGRWVRYGPKKKAYYRIEERVSRAGNVFYVGAFGFKGNGPHVLGYAGPQLTPREIKELEQKREAARARDARRRGAEIQRAANNALATWRDAAPEGHSAYLQRKRVPLTGGWVRFRDGNVIVPMARYDLPEGERLKGVQIIRPDGEKRFTYGMEKVGTAAVLGLHVEPRPILICEGLATAASCWLALERAHRVVVAFDAGNLQPVARILRARHPQAPLLICADDDYQTEGNPGRIKANFAAREIGGGVVFPLFRDRGGAKLTDFNDLHAAEGLAEVRHQLRSALEWLDKL